MAELVESGKIVDIILLLIVLEALILFILSKKKLIALQVGFLPYLIHILPGILIFIALRAVMIGAEWIWLATLLAASGIAHVIDLIYLFKTRE